MQTAAKINLNLTGFSSFKGLVGLQVTKPHELYQQFILGLFKGYGAQTDYLVDRLSALAHYAYALRRMDIIEEISHILLNLPIPDQNKNVGRYYQAMCLRYKGKISESKSLLERVAESGPLRYRARAVQYLGAIAHANGEHQEAIPLYVEACRMSISNNWCDPYTTVTASQNIAIVRSMEGDHKDALAGLEQLFPLVQALGKFEPYKYHHYLNSYAVELGEAGRLKEAQNVCRITLASPFAFAYPEWRETGQDLALRGYKSRSLVPIIQSFPGNVVPMPEREPTATSTHPAIFGPAPVQGLKEWKEEKMVKEPNGNGEDENVDEMDFNELIVKLLQLTAHEEADEKKVRKVVKAAIEIMKGKD